MSVIVWASTIGAVVGPRLVGPMGERVAPLGWPDFTGGFMTAFGAFILAGLVTLVALRPDPTSVAIIDVESESEQAAPTARFLEVLRRPAVIVACVTRTSCDVDTNMATELALASSASGACSAMRSIASVLTLRTVSGIPVTGATDARSLPRDQAFVQS